MRRALTFFCALFVAGTCFAIPPWVLMQQAPPSSGGGVSVPNPNVAWYKFTEGSGMTTADSSGNGFNGTLHTGVTWATGPTGNGALSFLAAATSYVSTTCNSSLGDFTVSLWFFATTVNVVGANYERLVDKSYLNGFYLGHNGTSGDVTQWGGGIQQSIAPYGTFSTLTLGQWNMLAMSRSGTTQKIYVNGALVQTASVPNGTTDTTLFNIGSDGGSAADSFTGMIADVGIWNSALSDAQVSAWYAQGAH